MATVTVIFVGGDSFVDNVIEKVTSGDYSHVAIKINGGVLESTGIMKEGDKYPGVHIRPINEYAGNHDAVFIDVDLPDLSAAELKAKQLLGKFYSYVGCIEGGTHSIFGINLHPIISKLINMSVIRFLHLPVNIDTGEWTMNCSETVTRILRAGGLFVCPGIDADCVTPMDLYRYLTVNEQFKINEKREFIMSEETTTTTTEAIETATDTAVATATESVTTAVETATTAAATTTASTIQTTIAEVADVAEDGISKLTDKIAELSAEIKTTKSLWVKIRNTLEIGTLSTLLAKAAKKLIK